jgi:hypothetical protein
VVLLRTTGLDSDLEAVLQVFNDRGNFGVQAYLDPVRLKDVLPSGVEFGFKGTQKAPSAC